MVLVSSGHYLKFAYLLLYGLFQVISCTYSVISQSEFKHWKQVNVSIVSFPVLTTTWAHKGCLIDACPNELPQ